MSDLIKREDAIRWVKTECNPYGKPTLDFESGKKVIEHLEHMPSADRPQGEWIFKPTFPNDKSEFPMGSLVCSVCGSHHSNSTPCNYCDNCGARMKGADDETD
jgi:hypothetical protein